MVCSLYVHIPVCLNKCDYCDFFSVPRSRFPISDTPDRPYAGFIQSLIREIETRTAELGITGWKTVYIGGGTPSLLHPEDIRALGRCISRSIPQDTDYTEWTIEANPEDLTAEWLTACRESGINRLSMGIQSMQDSELSGIGRRGSRQSNIEALTLVRQCWPGQLSLDLISGLPGQTREKLMSDISEIAAFHPDHISLYSLTVEEGTPLEEKTSGTGSITLPDDDEAAELWICGRDFLETRGYLQYEVSNFSLNGCQSRHNLTYWNLDTYIGVGPGATGTIIQGDTAVRNTNTRDISMWLHNSAESFETEIIDRAECRREVLMMGMRLMAGLSRKRFKERFDQDILDLISQTAKRWENRGLLAITPESIALNRDGLLLLNSFLVECLEEMCEK